MKVSIIINNYNYALFLEDAIQSAVNQTYPDKEIIIVDDGSTDGTDAILKKYEDQARIIRKKNGGQASAFNAGFAVATGDVVLFLDSDDRLHADAIKEALVQWQPNLSRLQFNLNLIDSEGKATGDNYTQIFLEGVMISGDYRRLVEDYRLTCMPTSGNIFSRKVLQHIFPLNEEDWRICADTPLIVSSAFYGPVHSILKPLGDYRIHNNGWFRTGSISAKDYFKQMDLRLKTEKHLGVPSQTRRYWIAKMAYEKLEGEGTHWPTVLEGMKATKREIRSSGYIRLVEMLWFPWVALMPQWLSRYVLSWHLPIGKPHICPHNLAKAKREYKGS